MDGVPVFNLVRETMPAIAIDGFRGVINSTCNFILSELERGKEFDQAVAEMQARGIAEADPSLDVDGWDAAAKTAALVNVLMGSAMTPHQVARTGIREVTGLRRARGDVAQPPHPAGGVGDATGRQGPRARRARDARSHRSAGRPRGSRERAVSQHRPARPGRHRPTNRRPDADRLCAVERPRAHFPAHFATSDHQLFTRGATCPDL